MVVLILLSGYIIFILFMIKICCNRPYFPYYDG